MDAADIVRRETKFMLSNFVPYKQFAGHVEQIASHEKIFWRVE